MGSRKIIVFLGVIPIAISFSGCSLQDSPAKEATPVVRPWASAKTDVDRHRILAYKGHVKERDGKRLIGAVGVLFAIYDQKEGGAPIWQEVQNAVVDERGHFSVMVGAATTEGFAPSSLL